MCKTLMFAISTGFLHSLVQKIVRDFQGSKSRPILRPYNRTRGSSVQSTRPCLKFKTAIVLNLRLVKSEKIFSFMYQVLRSRYAKSSTMMVKLCSMIKKERHTILILFFRQLLIYYQNNQPVQRQPSPLIRCHINSLDISS